MHRTRGPVVRWPQGHRGIQRVPLVLLQGPQPAQRGPSWGSNPDCAPDTSKAAEGLTCIPGKFATVTPHRRVKGPRWGTVEPHWCIAALCTPMATSISPFVIFPGLLVVYILPFPPQVFLLFWCSCGTAESLPQLAPIFTLHTQLYLWLWYVCHCSRCTHEKVLQHWSSSNSGIDPTMKRSVWLMTVDW